MILRSENADFLLIRQTDHAELSGVFAQQWRNDTFARPDPFDSVCLASALHDNGWEEWEAAPKIDPETHYPYQFTDLPVEEHLSFYLQGISRALEKDRYAGLLVSMHCSGIYRQRYGTDPSLKLGRSTPEVEHIVNGFLHRLETQQSELRAQLRAAASTGSTSVSPSRLTEEAIWTNYKLLQIVDRLSLYLCMAPVCQHSLGPAPVDDGRDAELELRPVDSQTSVVSPYPFAESPLQVSVKARMVPRQVYQSDQQFCEILARAETIPLAFELRAG